MPGKYENLDPSISDMIWKCNLSVSDCKRIFTNETSG